MKKLTMVRNLITLVCLTVITSHHALATSIRQFSLDELLDKSELVFEGRVLGTRQATRGEMIYTYVKFEITDLIKGDYAGGELELRFLGGSDGNTRLSVAESVIPSSNETGIYFIESTSTNLINPILGWSQGHFLVEYDEDGVQRITTNQDEPVTSLDDSGGRSALSRSSRSARGAAMGVRVERSLPLESAMSLEDFKNGLLDMMEVKQP